MQEAYESDGKKVEKSLLELESIPAQSNVLPQLADTLQKEVKVNYPDTLEMLGNPYEIVRIPVQMEEWNPVISEDVVKGEDVQLLFLVMLFILILLGILVSLYRSFIPRMYKAVFNDNYMKLLLRSANEPVKWKLISFYTFFFINAGLFIYLSLARFNFDLWHRGPALLLACCLAVMIFFGIKHLILWYISRFFPPEKEATLFNFILIVFNCLLGLVLVPINGLLAFGAEQVGGIVFFTGVGLWLLIYIFKQLKGLLIGARIWLNNVFHFFLYLCAVEIIPICVLWKLAQMT